MKHETNKTVRVKITYARAMGGEKLSELNEFNEFNEFNKLNKYQIKLPIKLPDLPANGGATRPRVGICLSRLDALTSKYTTQVVLASWGIEPQLTNADAGTRRPPFAGASAHS